MFFWLIIKCKLYLLTSFKRAPPPLQDGQPIYMAIKGVVFDVTTGKGQMLYTTSPSSIFCVLVEVSN